MSRLGKTRVGYMRKIENLDKYIADCSNLQQADVHRDDKKNLIETIIHVYEAEIPNIRSGLSEYKPGVHLVYDPPCEFYYDSDLGLLRAKLVNFKDNLEMELQAQPVVAPTVNVTQNNTNKATSSTDMDTIQDSSATIADNPDVPILDNSPHIKAGGNITAGGNINIGNTGNYSLSTLSVDELEKDKIAYEKRYEEIKERRHSVFRVTLVLGLVMLLLGALFWWLLDPEWPIGLTILGGIVCLIAVSIYSSELEEEQKNREELERIENQIKVLKYRPD